MKNILAVLLTIFMATTICISFTACEEELPTSEEVIEKLVAAQYSIESYEIEMKMNMKMAMDVPDGDMPEGMFMDMDIEADIAGAIDKSGEEMKVLIDMEMSAPDEDPINVNMEMYFVDGWIYMMMDMPMMSPQWMKSEMSYGEFLEEMGEIASVESQIEMLKTADIKIKGKEKVRGVNCYVVELTPDMKQLWDMLMQQSQITGGEIPDIPVENINEMIRSYSVKYWIAEDTYYLIKSEEEIDVEITPEAMGISGEEGSVKMGVTVSTLMLNYNEPVSIVLPPEAEDAVEQSMW